ncbi:putative mitochondrial protein [Quercus suber]|uniref:Mitochondrial protein n=1 Tax=Quercus suber TaxID=58331 RepID=A0AAW0L4M6_QUESU
MRMPHVGKCVPCHIPCLPKVPRGQTRHNRATTQAPLPPTKGDRRQPSQPYQDLQTRPERPRKATRLADRGSLEFLVCSKTFLSCLSKK